MLSIQQQGLWWLWLYEHVGSYAWWALVPLGVILAVCVITAMDGPKVSTIR